MPRKSLKYVNTYIDRTGTLRSYLRIPGKPRTPISGMPGSQEFMREYKILTAKAPKLPKRPPRVRLQRPPNGQIYYLSDGEHIKIGFTLDWSKRKRAYTTYSPQPLELLAIHPGTSEREKQLHRIFRPFRIKNEWFYQSPEILDHIKRTIDELNT